MTRLSARPKPRIARPSIELLVECDKFEEWLPLYEALLAIANDDPDRLQRLALEVRVPAQELQRRLTSVP
ncbi:MAG: hypothetical protein NTY19_21735 [Planctomycetota bacterium]|nr:hypothetical protein [Planctomycetota bacterium]